MSIAQGRAIICDVSARGQYPVPHESVPNTSALREGLARYETIDQLRASRFFSAHRGELETLLATPLTGGPVVDSPVPAKLRVVQWNIEKGLEFEGIASLLEKDAVLSTADVIMLNEVDLGMARTANRHVARELADCFGLNWVFAPAHIELTKGVGRDLDAPGENTVGLQGNAILARGRLVDARIVPLPACFEPYHFHEKRYGRRVALLARISTMNGDITLCGMHLEVRNTPACRARQVGTVLSLLPTDGPVLIGGDFNCSTFPRGTVLRTVAGTARLLGSVDRLRTDLLDPRGREGLFEALRKAGFETSGMNAAEHTIIERIDALEDARHLPGPVRRVILRRLDRLGRQLAMRLDWFAARGLEASGARNVAAIEHGRRVSDHDAIVVDVRVA